MMRLLVSGLVAGLVVLSGVATACAQQQQPAAAEPGLLPGMAPATGYRLVSPLVDPTRSPGVVLLMELEGQFGEDVKQHGGKAFARWFAEDAVTLANGKPAVMGRGAIAAGANWDPTVYTLSWQPQGAQMSASNEMGFTWGHYTGSSRDAQGNPVETSGRYITIWRKVADGSWKVAMDASSDDAPESGTCCALPKP